MKTHQENFIHAFEASPAGKTDLAAFAERLRGISSAAVSLRGRIAKYAEGIDNASLRRQAEGLRTWMDINGEGLSVAARVAELGADWADDIRKQLEIASRDLARLEDLREQDASIVAADILGEVNGILDSMEAIYQPSTSTAMPVPEKAVESTHAFAR